MNRKELEAVIACADHGSIAQAAKHLGVNRTSISRKLSKLEQELGVDLFLVTPEGIVPTYGGEIYLRTAREILALYQKTLTNIHKDFTEYEN